MLIKQEERDVLCDRVFQNDHHLVKKENENPLHCQGIVARGSYSPKRSLKGEFTQKFLSSKVLSHTNRTKNLKTKN